MLRIFVTGGTFDKVHDPLRECLAFGKTHIPEMLGIGRNTGSITVEELMLVDSLEMTDEQRNKILEKCRDCDENRAVITHGTSTMVETARLLGEKVKGKTIVLTGAMVPHSVKNSDATFNLAYALGAAQSLPEGVYIAMNGRVFSWDNVRKMPETGKFAEAK